MPTEHLKEDFLITGSLLSAPTVSTGSMAGGPGISLGTGAVAGVIQKQRERRKALQGWAKARGEDGDLKDGTREDRRSGSRRSRAPVADKTGNGAPVQKAEIGQNLGTQVPWPQRPRYHVKCILKRKKKKKRK